MDKEKKGSKKTERLETFTYYNEGQAYIIQAVDGQKAWEKFLKLAKPKKWQTE